MLVHLLLIVGIVWVFCCALYVVSEITIPENTIDFCRRINKVIFYEWVSALVYSIILIPTNYFWFGIVLFQVSCWHVIQHVKEGAPFSPQEAHKKSFRDKKITFYTCKIVGYTIIFLTLIFNGAMILINNFLASPLRNLIPA